MLWQPQQADLPSCTLQAQSSAEVPGVHAASLVLFHAKATHVCQSEVPLCT